MLDNAEQRVLMLTTEAAIRLALLAALLVACARIVWPFLLPVIWGMIIAIAVWPLFYRLRVALGDRPKRAAILFTLVALTLLLVPCWLVADSTVSALHSAGNELAHGTAALPPLPENAAEWPLIGEKLDAEWNRIIEDPPAAVHNFRSQIREIGSAMLSMVSNLGLGVLQFAFSIVLAGVFLATAKGGTRVAATMSRRLAGEQRGRQLVLTAARTVSSVVKGVLGVAFVQAVGAVVGFLLAGVPGAVGWGLLVLFLAIIQLPPLLVMLPMIFYVFSTTSTIGAVAFMIWAILVSVSDMFLKPLFLGRGVEAPMLVVLIGALGGMVAWGMLGLFVGAVVLTVGYQLSRAWVYDPDLAPEAGQPAST